MKQPEPLKDFKDIIRQHIKDNKKSLQRMVKLTKGLRRLTKEFRRGL